MKVERLKAAVEELQDIINEMQTEVNDFQAKKSEWYDFHLQLFRSGLMNNDQFERHVWNECQSMRTLFDDDLYAIQRLAAGLEKRYEAFKQLDAHLRRVKASTPYNKPWDWKEWLVRFKDSDDGREEEQKFFGPSADYAVGKCMIENKYDGNTIDIIEVREVEA